MAPVSTTPALGQRRTTRRATELVSRFKILDMKFHKACRQVVILNQKITDLQARYNRAFNEDRKSYRYTLRLQLSTTEGIRNMFYEYVTTTADRLNEMQDELEEVGLLEEATAHLV